MKGRVEARDLRDPGDGLPDRLDQRDLPRKVFRIEWGDPPQLVEQLRGDEPRLDETVPAVDDAVADGRDPCEPRVDREPLEHQADGRGLIRGLDRAILTPAAVPGVDDQPGLSEPHPLDATGEEPFDRVDRLEDRELQARRAAIDRQDVGPWRPIDRVRAARLSGVVRQACRRCSWGQSVSLLGLPTRLVAEFDVGGRSAVVEQHPGKRVPATMSETSTRYR